MVRSWLKGGMWWLVCLILTACQPDNGQGAPEVAADVVDTTSDGPATPDVPGDSREPSPFSLPWSVDLSQWHLTSSAHLQEGGEAISRVGFDDTSWLPARVPGTVMGAQMDAGELGDPLYADNLAHLPGFTLNFLPMPPGSPYLDSWWWRIEFPLPTEAASNHTWLVFEGINYSANVWFNGQPVASRQQVVGTFREFRFDVSQHAIPGEANALAVEVFAPVPLEDLSIYWVDWNPNAPDWNMGLWMPTRVEVTGPVSLRNPAVLSGLKENGSAELTLVAELSNHGSQAHDAVLQGEFDGRTLRWPIRLEAGEFREVVLTSAELEVLRVEEPRLWWPYQYGDPHLYPMELELHVDGRSSDAARFSFGIREVTAELTEHQALLYRINGQPILIRGGGWASDIFYRNDPERQRWELTYVRDMGLNTIRLEGKFEPRRFYEMCDEMGILLMPGWCCCDMWENWSRWKPEHEAIAKASLESQLRRLRQHASVFTWLNGSDFHPPADIESMYLDVATKARWNLPIASNATETPSEVTGPSGMKMTGPYQWVPPNYWYLAVPEDPAELTGTIDWEWMFGGAFGFNSESSPGPAIPPLDSLLKMMPTKDLWPIGEIFRFHSGNDPAQRLGYHQAGLDARLGPPTGLEDFAFKSQIIAYESHRAMFEAQGRNKYFATGHIQWMLNNAWPGMIWHLYDFFLRPAGSYYGAKAALRPVHAQLSYDDRSIWVVNSTLKTYGNLSLRIRVLDINSEIVLDRTVPLSGVGPDGNVSVASLAETLAQESDRLDPVYFVDLHLTAEDGQELDRSFYWMPYQQDTYGWQSTQDNYPDATLADMTALNTLQRAYLIFPRLETNKSQNGIEVVVEVKNTSHTLAFFLEFLVLTGTSRDPALPVLWNDNYISILPGESRSLRAVVPTTALQGESPTLQISGWNVNTMVWTELPSP